MAAPSLSHREARAPIAPDRNGVVYGLVVLSACAVIASGGEYGGSRADPVVAHESTAAAVPALARCGAALCAGERRFDWNGVTAFALADLVAEGRLADARAFVSWARATGFTILRVLAMLPSGGWMNLSPEDGRRALPAVFEMARAEGLYVQVVALANTNERSGRFRTDAFLRAQVGETARLCADAGNCVLEFANEPYHGSQAALDDPARMRMLALEVPGGLPVAWGATERDDSPRMSGGDFVVVHLARSGRWWDRVSRASDLARLSLAVGKFVVDNEPIGAAERAEPNRRESNPDAFLAQGIAARLAAAGATFHCEDCLLARVPGPVQQRCATAFMEGRRLVPERQSMSMVPADGVATLPPGGQGRLLAAAAGERAWVLALGPAARGLSWTAGWRGDRRLLARDELLVWTARRSAP